MKITIAQLNPTIGDIHGNLQKALSALEKGSKAQADLVVLPELFITGYPPKDLLERTWFIKNVQKAIATLVKETKKHPTTGVVIGTPWPTGTKAGNGLFNAALVLYKGKILGVQAKSLLPTYDVFDEARHFEPALTVKPIPFKGEKLGISICEDAWNIQELWPEKRVYSRDPVALLAKQKATLMINISASPFSAGKEAIRWKIIKKHALKYKKPFIYVNQIGGNDELVFDGRSIVVNTKGQALNIAPGFQEYCATVDLAQKKTCIYKPQPKIQTIYEALVLGTHDYLHKCGFKKAVIGLSGGIDSAVVACIAKDALGSKNVLGISMPSPFSSTGSIEDSRALAQNLGIDFKVIPITPVYEEYLKTFQDAFVGHERDITEENIQARIRGNILMAFSNKFGCLTLATGNKSELSTGYCTLYGDMSGGLSVIADLPKMTVYALAAHINRKSLVIPKAIIDKAPSAELRPDQTDQDTLPPYPVLDQILQLYIEEGYSLEALFKKKFDPEVVQWVIKAVDRNEYKRRQAAPGLKVTGKAFGMGRRMPIAAKIQYK